MFALCVKKQREGQMAENKNYKIICAENAGFCFGVRRAVDTVLELRKKTGKRIYSIGELIHNGVFLERLEKDNIFCIEEENLKELEKDKEGNFKARFPDKNNHSIDATRYSLVFARPPRQKKELPASNKFVVATPTGPKKPWAKGMVKQPML